MSATSIASSVRRTGLAFYPFCAGLLRRSVKLKSGAHVSTETFSLTMPRQTPPRRRSDPAKRRRRTVNPGAPAAVDLGELPRLVGYALRRAQLVVFQDFFRT